MGLFYDRKPNPEPKFCKRCGNLLSRDEEVLRADPKTGEPLQIKVHLVCHAALWQNGHTALLWKEKLPQRQ